MRNNILKIGLLFSFCVWLLWTLASCKKTPEPPTCFPDVSETEVVIGRTDLSIVGSVEYPGKVYKLRLLLGTDTMALNRYKIELDGSDFSVTVNNLEPATLYYYRYSIDVGMSVECQTPMEQFLTQSAEMAMVKTGEVTEISYTSAKGSGEVMNEGSSPVTERGLCWSTHQEPTVADSTSHSGTGLGTYSIVMNNLIPNTIYYVRAYAKTELGLSYGNEVQFVTLTQVGDDAPVVKTGEVTDILYTSAKGSGEVTDEGANPVTERGLCWSTHQEPTVADSTSHSGTGLGTYSIVMNNLIPNTIYYVRAYAKTEQSLSYGNEVQFITLAQEGGDGPVVTTGVVSHIETTSVRCSGEVISEGTSNVTSRGICYSIGHNPTVSDHYASATAGMGSFEVELSDLVPNTIYYARAYATNNHDTSYGSEVSFITLISLTTDEVVSIMQTTALVKGSIDVGGGAEISERGICWSTSPNPSLGDAHLSSGNGAGSYSSELTGLSANTIYYVRTYARNSDLPSYGNVVSFLTRANPPQVRTLSISHWLNTATLKGKVTVDDGSEITARGFCWSTSHAPSLTDGNHKECDEAGLGEFSLQIDSLNQNTTYYVRAYATNRETTSYGDEKEFTTYYLPLLTTAEASDITSTTAMGGGTVTEEGTWEVTERGVCWSTSHNPSVWGAHANSATGGGGGFTVQMTGLNQNTTYYVRAYAKTQYGISYGNEVSFVSHGVPTVTTSAVTYVQGLTATGGGEVINDGFETVTERGVCWSTSHNPTIGNSHASCSTGGMGSFSVEISGLAQGTQYHVRAYAMNSVGVAYGNEVDFSTGPEGVLIVGTYSVSASKQVWFSKGNLQYQSSSWKFANYQWEILGDNGQGSTNSSAVRDLFGWGTSGYNHGAVCYQPWSTSQTENNYYAYGSANKNLYDGSGKADWGYNAITNGGNQAHYGWRTLKTEEWDYLLNTRVTGSGKRFAKAIVNNVKGLILLPDDWDPAIYDLKFCNKKDVSYDKNMISASDWTNILESGGAVFLPVGGFRSGISISVGSNGYYWSSSHNNSSGAYRILFSDSDVSVSSTSRFYGFSVRLVCDVD